MFKIINKTELTQLRLNNENLKQENARLQQQNTQLQSNQLSISELQQQVSELKQQLQQQQMLAATLNEHGQSLQQYTHSFHQNNHQLIQQTDAIEKRNSDFPNTEQKLQKMNQSLLNMQKISKSNQQSFAQLNELTTEIGQFVSHIHQISEQTNLLALNASIEAARAGTHGRGFAVVADEVRALAHRANQAATEISTLVNKITSSAHVTEAAINDTVMQTHHTSNIAQELIEDSRQLIGFSANSGEILLGCATRYFVTSSLLEYSSLYLQAHQQENHNIPDVDHTVFGSLVASHPQTNEFTRPGGILEHFYDKANDFHQRLEFVKQQPSNENFNKLERSYHDIMDYVKKAEKKFLEL
ncbi:methyl-accepting chemotaxis protein [Paraferrimonas sp. SM1919]|uniref:methyl-accepting chemotaxis protein n=1 Tax=Paraferrimonas sp. SM1919 TaxID=2662263 RepID=UPI0013D2D89F|nr:methyl-accepting chemotaxis protein [Paraferrimonas sp. SM1919]